MDTTLLAVLAVYGAVGGVLGAAALRWCIGNYYAFPRLGRVRYAISALFFGGFFGFSLTAGVAVALHVSAPADFAAAVGAGVAVLIALVQGMPKETGLALPPAYRDAMHEIARTGSPFGFMDRFRVDRLARKSARSPMPSVPDDQD